MTQAANQTDRIQSVRISSCYLPLATPISDAKVLTGRQKPMTEIAILFAQIRTADGQEGWVSAIPNARAARASLRMPKKSRRF
jgi:hypothetical protein